MVKICLFGASGMLGSYVYLVLKGNYQIYCPNRKTYDITSNNKNELEKILTKELNSEDIVINCSGIIPQKYEYDVNMYVNGNTVFPKHLSEISDKFNYKLIHITTDCVYTGNKGNYQTNDKHDSEDIYGKSKSLGEEINACIIRTSIIGEESNTKKSLLEWIISNKGQTINGYTNHIWNGVTCLTLAKTIKNIIDKNLFWIGIKHLFSSETVTKYTLCKYIDSIYHLGCLIVSHEDNISKNMSLSGQDGKDSIIINKSLTEQVYEQMIYLKMCLPNISSDLSTYPFPHLIIDNFLSINIATEIRKEILNINEEEWDRYENPFKKKYTLRNKYNFPILLDKLFDDFQSPKFVQQLSNLFGHKLLLDPTRNFWGVHKYKTGDKLDIHVDAGLHPSTKQKKILTFGLYLSNNWSEDYGGELELWKGENSSGENPHISELCLKVSPIFNRMIIFLCDDFSWHGNPEPIICPEEATRVFVTISYLCDENPYKNMRSKAYFVGRPGDPIDLNKDKLRLLRADPEKYKDVYRMGK